MRKINAALLYLPMLLAVCAAILSIVNMPGLFVPDTVAYLNHGLLEPGKEFFFTNPGYSIVLDLVRLLAPLHARMFLLVLIQQAAIVAAVTLLSRVGGMLGMPKAGLFMGLACALYLPLYHFAQTSQQESIYVFYVACCTYFAVRGWSRGKVLDLAIAGAFAGLSVAQRSIGLAVLGTLVLSMLLGRGENRWRGMAAAIAAYTLVIAVFLGINKLHHGSARLVKGTGIHLFGRVAMIEKTVADTAESRRLRKLLSEQGVEELFFENAGWSFHPLLRWKAGLGADEADALLKTVALQTLQEDPWRTIQGSIRSIRFATDNHYPIGYLLWGGLRPEGFDAHCAGTLKAWKDSNELIRAAELLLPYRGEPKFGAWVYDFFEYWGAMGSWLWRGLWVLIAMPLLCVFGLVRRNRVLLLFSGLALAQMIAMAMGDQPKPRYWDPCVPFFAIAVVLAVSEIVAIVRDRRARDQEPTDAEEPGVITGPAEPADEIEISGGEAY